MATIKSFTDISQSKKLAEILPIETADMKWYFWKSGIDAPKLPTFGYSKDAAESYKSTEAVYLPCWSLATLLNYLRKIDFFPEIDADKCEVTMNIKLLSHTAIHNIKVKAKNFIDACYEMILKLHEQKVL